LTGSVPDLIGKQKKLDGLHLNVNRFSGSILSALSNLTRLTRLSWRKTDSKETYLQVLETAEVCKI